MTEIKAEDEKVRAMKGWLKEEEVAVDEWPDVTDKELYDYLVCSCKKSVDKKSKGARRQLKASIFYDDGHVYEPQYVFLTLL